MAILGGGIAGVSLAARLAAHRSVALIEREPALGAATTARSAAMFLPSYGGAAVAPLAQVSRDFFCSSTCGGGAIFRPRPALHIGRHPHLHRFGLAQPAEVRLQALSPTEAVRHVPILRQSALDGAWLEVEAGDLDVAALLDLFRRTALDDGAQIVVDAREPSIERRREGWRLSFAGGAIDAGVLVNAAGPWADLVAERAGIAPLGLSVLRRTVVLAPPVARDGFDDWPVVKDVRERFYFRPYHGRLLITPADAHPSPPCDPAPEPCDIARAMLRFQTACDHAVPRIERSWAGLRTFTSDQAPAIGWARGEETFFWLAGLGGFGVQTAPAASLLAASLILDRAIPADLGDVRPALYAPARLDDNRRRLTTVKDRARGAGIVRGGAMSSKATT